MASCIFTDPNDTVTQVHVLVKVLNAGHQRFYLTRSLRRHSKRRSRSRCAKTSVSWLRCIIAPLKSLSLYRPTRLSSILTHSVLWATGFDDRWRRSNCFSFAIVSLFTARQFATRLHLCSLSPILTILSTQPYIQKTWPTSRCGASCWAKRI
uniref:Uncharacterized protein n=1 Tax=Hyaloperonospora arabidopsidis (strain Emoy2) TaxID=559515 RepID=M4B278_HYAAE